MGFALNVSDLFVVFIDGPIKLNPVDLAKTFGTEIEALDTEASASVDPALAPRGWWERGPDGTTIVGLEKSLDLLRDVLKGDRFDVRSCCRQSFSN